MHPTDTFTILVRELAAKVSIAMVVPNRETRKRRQKGKVIDLTNAKARICAKRARPDRANFSHSKSETTVRVVSLDSSVFLVFSPG